MKKLVIATILFIGFLGTQVAQAQPATVTATKAVRVYGLANQLGSLTIQLGTDTVEEGATTTLEGWVFDLYSNPLEGAVREWHPTLGTVSVRDGIYYKIDFPCGTATPQEGRVGTIYPPGIRSVLSFNTVGTQTGTVTVWEGGLLLGSPTPTIIPGTTTHKNFSVNVVKKPVPELATLEMFPVSATVTVGTSRDFYVIGKDKLGNPFTVPASCKWNTTAGTVSPTTGTITIFTAGTRTIIGTITATVGSITTSTTITLVFDLLAQIQVSPSFVSMTIGETRTFSTQGFDQYGNLRPDSDWDWKIKEGNGTISSLFGSSTVFTATEVGTITLQASKAGVKGTATIVVVAQKVLTSLEITGVATIIVGESGSFTVTGKDQYGQTMTIPGSVTWNSSIGTVTNLGSSSATFIASTTPGSATLTATYGTISATATITIVADKFAVLWVIEPPVSSVVGNWYPGITTLLEARDKYGNLTVFDPENGTCSVYIGCDYGDEANPAPPNYLYFLGNTFYVEVPNSINPSFTKYHSKIL